MKVAGGKVSTRVNMRVRKCDGKRERGRSLCVCGGGCRPMLLTSIIWTHRPELMTRVRHRREAFEVQVEGGGGRRAQVEEEE